MSLRSSLLIAALSASIVLVLFVARPSPNRAFMPDEFVVFYCAGHALDAQRSPYTAQPLGDCEHAYWPPGMLAGVSEPAAIPGYGLLPFMLLALLPFTAAKWLWLLLSCVAFGAAVAAGARLSALSPVAIFGLLFVPVAMLNVSTGQVTVFTIAAIFLCGVCLRAGRANLAALSALGALLQPHIALPLLIGLFVLVPRTRVLLLASIVALSAVHVGVLGLQPAIAYFSGVLPAMSRAELIASDQYGTMWWLHAAGVPAATAAAAANVAYVLAMVFGMRLASSAVRKFADPALAVVLPVAVVLPFAPYLHDIELGAALGAPLVMLGISPGDRRWNAIATLCATPWYGALHSVALALKCLLGTGVFLAFSTRPRERIVWVSAAACTIALVIAFTNPFPTGAELVTGAPLDAGALAAESWGRYLAAIAWMHAAGPQVVLPKLASWLPLLAIPVFVSKRR